MVRCHRAVQIGLLLACSMSAQVSTGSIGGALRDPTGAVIPHTRVALTHTETGLTTSVNAAGAKV